MGYRNTINGLSLSASDKQALNAEFDKAKADLTALRTAIIGALAKLDDDAGVTDTNYEATWTPAALTLIA